MKCWEGSKSFIQVIVGLNRLRVTNTLAYYNLELITYVKSFLLQAQWPVLLKLRSNYCQFYNSQNYEARAYPSEASHVNHCLICKC
jgi:hypothetical protein